MIVFVFAAYDTSNYCLQKLQRHDFLRSNFTSSTKGKQCSYILNFILKNHKV